MKKTNITIIVGAVAIIIAFSLFLTGLVMADPVPTMPNDNTQCRKDYREAIKTANITYAKEIKAANKAYKAILENAESLPKADQKQIKLQAKTDRKTAKKKAFNDAVTSKQTSSDQYKICKGKTQGS